MYTAGTTPAGAALAATPTFTPGPTAGTGLDLLAAAAAVTGGPTPPILATPGSRPLGKLGPYNPAAAIPAKVVRKILELEFVEMSEITLDDDLPQTPGRPSAPARLPITDISQWVERFSIMAALLACRFPEKAPELWAYQALIVRCERNYEGKRWVTFDRQFRREALARKDLNWSVPDSRLYNEAFTGRARAIPRCSFCLQDDHAASTCPRNPNRAMFGWFPDPLVFSPQQQPSQHGAGTPPAAPQQEPCRRYNDAKCKKHFCRYRHACTICLGQHPAIDCPQRPAGRMGRSRSPRPNPRGAPGQPGQRF